MLDVIIVGGGPAGLSAALVLGRCRRNVLVCDSGKPRNAPSRAMHGFLSRDGISPAEFIEISRGQLQTYPNVELRSGEITEVVHEKPHFLVTMPDGRREATRTVLLATGITDEWPEIEGFDQFHGRTVHHCPYCDGWENRDGPLAVYGRKTAQAELAIELLCWSRDVILCTDGPPEFDGDMAAKLDRLNIRRIETKVAALEGEGDTLRGVRFADGAFLERQALFVTSTQRQTGNLAKTLGCEMDAEGAIKCGEGTSTCVPGLFVAGNASWGLQLVIIAAAEGTQAAFTINQALIELDTNREAATCTPVGQCPTDGGKKKCEAAGE